jgi:hypothetical protein
MPEGPLSDRLAALTQIKRGKGNCAMLLFYDNA